MKKALISFLFLTTWVFAQKSTEMYIPIGKSPGLSGTKTLIGTIQIVDYPNFSVTLQNPQGSHKVKVTPKTRIWLDRSELHQTNAVGTFASCKKGLEAEVNWAKGASPTASVADWIKLRITSNQ